MTGAVSEVLTELVEPVPTPGVAGFFAEFQSVPEGSLAIDGKHLAMSCHLLGEFAFAAAPA